MLTVVGILSAAPVLALLVVHVWLFLRSILRHPTLEQLIALLYLWQTLTGAAFAIAAALIGATVVLHQTATTQRLEERRRAARATALRAVLPLALSELSDYARRCVEGYANLLALGGNLVIRVGPLSFPQVPKGLVPLLTELIEESEPDHARPLVVLVRRVQISHARMQDTMQRAGPAAEHGSILVRQNLISRVIDVAEISARCDKLFIYARSEAETPADPTVAGDVVTALRLIPAVFPYMDELEKEVQRRAAILDHGLSWPDQ